MPGRRVVHLEIEVEIDEASISGRVIAAEAPVRPFAGRLGLITAVDEALSAGEESARNEARPIRDQ